MPSLPFSQAMTANQLGFNPLLGWQFEIVPYPRAYVQLLVRSTTVGNRITVFAGSTTIQQRSPVQGGGTAGVTPSPLNTPMLDFIATAGDRLILQIDEVAGGTPTVDGIISINPV